MPGFVKWKKKHTSLTQLCFSIYLFETSICIGGFYFQKIKTNLSIEANNINVSLLLIFLSNKKKKSLDSKVETSKSNKHRNRSWYTGVVCLPPAYLMNEQNLSIFFFYLNSNWTCDLEYYFHIFFIFFCVFVS